MSEFKPTIDPTITDLFVSRVPNGWALYNNSPYDLRNDCMSRPIAVARTARELSGYLQGWAERQDPT